MKYIFVILINVLMLTSAHAEIKDILSSIDNNEMLASLNNSCPAEIYSEPEKKYQDYIYHCKTDMKSCLSKCMDGSSNHCFGLANNLQTDSIDKKYAEQLYSLACKQGLITACTNRAAGIMRFNPDDKECYAKSFKLTCSKSDAWGCTMYGLVLSRGIGFEQDNELALSVLKTGCKYGVEDEACKYAKAIEQDIEDSKSK